MKERKKKWYETWWGLLWTLAIVDAHPGSGLQTFVDVDRQMQDLVESENQDAVMESAGARIVKQTEPFPAGAAGGS